MSGSLARTCEYEKLMNAPDPTYPVRTYKNDSGGPATKTEIGNASSSKCFEELRLDLGADQTLKGLLVSNSKSSTDLIDKV
jgi:hypothetical protein